MILQYLKRVNNIAKSWQHVAGLEFLSGFPMEYESKISLLITYSLAIFILQGPKPECKHQIRS